MTVHLCLSQLHSGTAEEEQCSSDNATARGGVLTACAPTSRWKWPRGAAVLWAGSCQKWTAWCPSSSLSRVRAHVFLFVVMSELTFSPWCRFLKHLYPFLFFLVLAQDTGVFADSIYMPTSLHHLQTLRGKLTAVVYTWLLCFILLTMF